MNRVSEINRPPFSWTVTCHLMKFFMQSLSSNDSLTSLIHGLPEMLQRQYDYEEPVVRSGKHLMHSPFFKVSSELVNL